ncbi:MAG: LppX_LprAFG lipoprotein [Ktedonobacterales bacterium]
MRGFALTYRAHGHRLPLALLAALVLLLAACGGASAPGASSLLQAAQQKFAATTSLHFIMTVDHAGHPQNVGDFVITSADGDVVRPDKLQASAGVDAGILSTTLQIIFIGTQEWWTDPTNGNQWTPTTRFSNFPIVKLFDPTAGIGSLLPQLQHPSVPSDGSANGASCWKVSGTIDPHLVQPLFPGGTATQPVPTTFCIGKTDQHLDSASLSGPIFAGDLSNTVHTFYFSKFGEIVDIKPPLD